MPVADEFGLNMRTGAHQAGAYGSNTDAFVAEFGMEAFGKSYEGELARHIRQQVRHGKFAADARDVDDAALSASRFAALEHMRDCRLDGVQSGEEVCIHGLAEGGEGLVFKRPTLDDAGIVY